MCSATSRHIEIFADIVNPPTEEANIDIADAARADITDATEAVRNG